VVGLLLSFVVGFCGWCALLLRVGEFFGDSLGFLDPLDVLKSGEFELDAFCILYARGDIDQHFSLDCVSWEVALTISFNMESRHTTALL